MRKIDNIKKKVYYEFISIKNTVKYLLFPQKYILLKASIIYDKGRVKKFNWGDDVSFELVSILSQKKPLFYPSTRFTKIFPVTSYMTIGSIISYLSYADLKYVLTLCIELT